MMRPITLASTLESFALLCRDDIGVSLVRPVTRWVGIARSRSRASGGGSWTDGREACWQSGWIRPGRCCLWVGPRWLGRTPWTPRHGQGGWKESRKREASNKVEASHCDLLLNV